MDGAEFLAKQRYPGLFSDAAVAAVPGVGPALEKLRAVALAQARQRADLEIYNPNGRIEPAFLGQMFRDGRNDIFYQARGLTADDWALVTPPELSGCFPKTLSFFLGHALLQMQGTPVEAEYREAFIDGEAVKSTMLLDGLRVLQSFGWQTAGGVNVAMVRLKFDTVDDRALFFGFTNRPQSDHLPVDIGTDCKLLQREPNFGFLISRGWLWFSPLDDGSQEMSPIEQGTIISLRAESDRLATRLYVNDALVSMQVALNFPGIPILSLFRTDPGPRPLAAGYDVALKKMMDACQKH